jgi:hypothetical protein
MNLRPQAATLWLSLLAFLVTYVVSQEPTHEITSFENLPTKLVFIEDTYVRFLLFLSVLMLKLP